MAERITEPDIVDTLVVKEYFRKFYICNKCNTICYFCVTNTFDSLPQPTICPYSKKEKPDWKPMYSL